VYYKGDKGPGSTQWVDIVQALTLYYYYNYYHYYLEYSITQLMTHDLLH